MNPLVDEIKSILDAARGNVAKVVNNELSCPIGKLEKSLFITDRMIVLGQSMGNRL